MFTLLGLVLVGPTLHFWYISLSKLVSGSGAYSAGLRLLLDQFLFSPLFIGVFFASFLTLEGRASEILPKLQQDWFASVQANWKIWIPFQVPEIPCCSTATPSSFSQCYCSCLECIPLICKPQKCSSDRILWFLKLQFAYMPVKAI